MGTGGASVDLPDAQPARATVSPAASRALARSGANRWWCGTDADEEADDDDDDAEDADVEEEEDDDEDEDEDVEDDEDVACGRRIDVGVATSVSSAARAISSSTTMRSTAPSPPPLPEPLWPVSASLACTPSPASDSVSGDKRSLQCSELATGDD